MNRRHPHFTAPPFNRDNHEAGQCWRWCKIHHYWNFEVEDHVPFPARYNYHSNTHGWVNAEVWCGPGGWYPKRPPKED